MDTLIYGSRSVHLTLASSSWPQVPGRKKKKSDTFAWRCAVRDLRAFDMIPAANARTWDGGNFSPTPFSLWWFGLFIASVSPRTHTCCCPIGSFFVQATPGEDSAHGLVHVARVGPIEDRRKSNILYIGYIL